LRNQARSGSEGRRDQGTKTEVALVFADTFEGAVGAVCQRAKTPFDFSVG